MHQEAREELRVRFKLTVLEYAHHVGVTKACREFNVARSTFYEWQQKYDRAGREGLCPAPRSCTSGSESHLTQPLVVTKLDYPRFSGR